jgi:hypothetical protein
MINSSYRVINVIKSIRLLNIIKVSTHQLTKPSTYQTINSSIHQLTKPSTYQLTLKLFNYLIKAHQILLKNLINYT